MMNRLLRTTAVLAVLVATTCLAGACAATDTAKQINDASKVVKEGLDTGNYLKSVNEQQQAYGRIVSSQTLTPPHNAAQAASFRKAATDLDDIASQLEGIKVDSKFAAAHQQLVKSVKDTAAAARKLAAAAAKEDTPAFNKAVTAWDDATTAFGNAVEESTKQLQKAADQANQDS